MEAVSEEKTEERREPTLRTGAWLCTKSAHTDMRDFRTAKPLGEGEKGAELPWQTILSSAAFAAQGGLHMLQMGENFTATCK